MKNRQGWLKTRSDPGLPDGDLSMESDRLGERVMLPLITSRGIGPRPRPLPALGIGPRGELSRDPPGVTGPRGREFVECDRDRECLDRAGEDECIESSESS